MTEKERLAERINELTGWHINVARMNIVTDTSDWMRITRGDVIKIGACDCEFVVRGNMREPRFGIDDQPKYWVFHAIDLKTGEEKIIKTVFNEEFYAHIGLFRIRCYRDPVKEANVIDFGRGDRRFMQGISFLDDAGNNVRVIDYIRGKSFFQVIPSVEKSHENYFKEDLPTILWNLKDSIDAIILLHQNGYCHGDIRNDHIYIDADDAQFRWIDFDLKQDVTDFDLWSIGNIISYATAKGIITFKHVNKSELFTKEQYDSLVQEDGSAFYNYRVMNLGKLFDYIPDSLSDILRHFTIRPIAFYASIDQFYDDYCNMLEKDFLSGKGKKFIHEQ
jgi:serine/threonine protein kinase